MSTAKKGTQVQTDSVPNNALAKAIKLLKEEKVDIPNNWDNDRIIAEARSKINEALGRKEKSGSTTEIQAAKNRSCGCMKRYLKAAGVSFGTDAGYEEIKPIYDSWKASR